MLAEAAAAPHDQRGPSRAPHILGITLPRERVGEGGGAAERMPRSPGPRRGARRRAGREVGDGELKPPGDARASAPSVGLQGESRQEEERAGK